MESRHPVCFRNNYKISINFEMLKETKVKNPISILINQFFDNPVYVLCRSY